MLFTTVNKLKLLFFFTLLGVTGANAQTFQWAKKIGATSGQNTGNAITTDAAGNTYTTGAFGGTVDFDPNAAVFNMTASGTDAFICKLSPAGNFLWAKQIGGTGSATGYAIDIDNSGNIIIMGTYSGTVDLDPGAAVSNVTSTAFWNIFVVKLNSAGNFVWGKKIAGTDNIHNYKCLATDATGNVILGGFFTGTIDFDPGAGTFNLSNAGGVTPDIFILKLTAAGNFSWAVRIGSTQPDYCRDIAVDDAGNVYAVGDFQGTVDFNPGAAVFNMTDAGGGYILKLTAAGSFVWAKQINNAGIDNTWMTSVEVDGTGYVYVSGGFYATADLDPGVATYNVTSAGAQDIFYIKLSPAGNFIWGKRVGGTQPDAVSDIALDRLNNIFTTGRFRQTVDFNPGAAVYNLTSLGTSDIFISKLTSGGNFVWALQMGSATSNYLSSSAITVDASFNVYTVGQFNSTLDFNPLAGAFNMTALGDWDIFIHKMASPSPLPIELLSFNATQNKNAVDVTWQTATELNNHYFTIQKSKDGKEFTDAGKIDGAGNSSTILEYSFTDKNPYAGLSYYRLKQTDFNGEFSYSKTVAVHINANANNPFIVFQNPATAQIIVAFKNTETQPCQLLIHDMAGRIVFKQQLTSATTILNTTFLPGIYVANVNTGQEVVSQKVVIK